jgi:hypothetical protein
MNLNKADGPAFGGVGRMTRAGAVLDQRVGRTMRRVAASRVARRGVVSTVGGGDALGAAFVHALVRTSDSDLAIERAVIFAGWLVGAAAGEDGWLSAEELTALHRSPGPMPSGRWPDAPASRPDQSSAPTPGARMPRPRRPSPMAHPGESPDCQVVRSHRVRHGRCPGAR